MTGHGALLSFCPARHLSIHHMSEIQAAKKVDLLTFNPFSIYWSFFQGDRICTHFINIRNFDLKRRKKIKDNNNASDDKNILHFAGMAEHFSSWGGGGAD